MTSDAWLQVALALIALAGTVFSGAMAFLMARLSRKQDAAAAKVDGVKADLDAATAAADRKLDAIAATGDMTHAVVNGGLGVQLGLAAAALRRVAALTHHADDAAAAALAEKAVQDHAAGQRATASPTAGGTRAEA